MRSWPGWSRLWSRLRSRLRPRLRPQLLVMDYAQSPLPLLQSGAGAALADGTRTAPVVPTTKGLQVLPSTRLCRLPLPRAWSRLWSRWRNGWALAPRARGPGFVSRCGHPGVCTVYGMGTIKRSSLSFAKSRASCPGSEFPILSTYLLSLCSCYHRSTSFVAHVKC